MGIGSRIDQLIRARGKRPGTLAREAGVSKNTVYSIIKRDNDKVDPAILSRLAHALGVPLSALYGAEEPLPSHPDILPVTTQRVPMLGSIACGEPIYKPGDGTEYATIEEGVACDFALIAQGDSMIGDRIHSGDLVFIRRQESVRDGEIAAVALDDELTLKRVRRILDPGGRVAFTQLLPSNPRYAPITIGGAQETRNVSILGKAVAVRFML